MFPLGDLFDMQVTLRMGQANVRRWTDELLRLLVGGEDDLALLGVLARRALPVRDPTDRIALARYDHAVMAAREERLARNENHFREINESLSDKHVHAVVVRSGPLPFVCECASPECTEAVELTLAEYREVRRDPRLFIVVPGHENPAAERVVEVKPGYAIVEKVGDAAAVAEEQQPA